MAFMKQMNNPIVIIILGLFLNKISLVLCLINPRIKCKCQASNYKRKTSLTSLHNKDYCNIEDIVYIKIKIHQIIQ